MKSGYEGDGHRQNPMYFRNQTLQCHTKTLLNLLAILRQIRSKVTILYFQNW